MLSSRGRQREHDLQRRLLRRRRLGDPAGNDARARRGAARPSVTGSPDPRAADRGRRVEPARPSRLRRRARSRDRGRRGPRGRPPANRDHRRRRSRRRLDPASRQHDHRARRPPLRPRPALDAPRGRRRLLSLAAPRLDRRYAGGMPKVEHVRLRRSQGLHGLGVQPRDRDAPRTASAVWVEGEVTELRRNDAWANVFLTLKDPKTGACLSVTIARRTFDRLELDLDEGETVHVAGRAEIYELKGELGCARPRSSGSGSATTCVALEHLKRQLAAEGLFAPSASAAAARPSRCRDPDRRRRRRSRRPRRDDRARFPATKLVVRETRVQGKGAAPAIVAALAELSSTRTSTSSSSRAAAAASRTSSRSATSPSSGLSPPPACPSSRPSGTSRTRRSATSQPTRARRLRPLRERSSCPISASSSSPSRLRDGGSGSRVRAAGRARPQRLVRQGERLRAAPRLLLERRRAALDRAGARLQTLSPLATLSRGYAIVRAGGDVLRAPPTSRRATRSTSSSLPARSARASRGAPVSEERVRGAAAELEEVVTRLERGDVPSTRRSRLPPRRRALQRVCRTPPSRRAPHRGARPARSNFKSARPEQRRRTPNDFSTACWVQ